MMNKGIIGEVFFSKKPINNKNARHKALLYCLGTKNEVKEEVVYVDSTLLIPILSQSDMKKIRGIIEISNS